MPPHVQERSGLAGPGHSDSEEELRAQIETNHRRFVSWHASLPPVIISDRRASSQSTLAAAMLPNESPVDSSRDDRVMQLPEERASQTNVTVINNSSAVTTTASSARRLSSTLPLSSRSYSADGPDLAQPSEEPTPVLHRSLGSRLRSPHARSSALSDQDRRRSRTLFERWRDRDEFRQTSAQGTDGSGVGQELQTSLSADVASSNGGNRTRNRLSGFLSQRFQSVDSRQSQIDDDPLDSNTPAPESTSRVRDGLQDEATTMPAPVPVSVSNDMPMQVDANSISRRNSFGTTTTRTQIVYEDIVDENEDSDEPDLSWLLTSVAEAVRERLTLPNTTHEPGASYGATLSEHDDAVEDIVLSIQHALLTRTYEPEFVGFHANFMASINNTRHHLMRTLRYHGRSLLSRSSSSIERPPPPRFFRRRPANEHSSEDDGGEGGVAILLLIVRPAQAAGTPSTLQRYTGRPIFRSNMRTASLLRTLQSLSSSTTSDDIPANEADRSSGTGQLAAATTTAAPSSSPRLYESVLPRNVSGASPSSPPSTPADSATTRSSGFGASLVRRLTSSTFDDDRNRHSRSGSTRSRRRSESEAARFRYLGAGSARRNGVVEPDSVDANDNADDQRSSGTVYVISAVMSEDQRIITAPSLFADNPTYEDMLLLSDLLGPVKPPVATRTQVDAAGGKYLVTRSTDSNGFAKAIKLDASNDDTKPTSIILQQRCLVCLQEYVAGESARRLTKCSHDFHSICIDEWLTTGRNSCPLCRGEGVRQQT